MANNKPTLTNFHSIQPLFFGAFIQENNSISITSGNKRILMKEISEEEKKLLINLFSLCDGINTTKKIISKLRNLECDIKKASNLLHQLLLQKILIDSREIYSQFHPYLNQVTPFYYKLTKEKIKSMVKKVDEFNYKGERILLQSPSNSTFCKLIRKRRTIRKFDEKKTIPFQIFSDLLYTTYGVSTETKIKDGKIFKRVIPSAGALYPLHIYCIVLRGIKKIPPGVYYFKKKNVKCSIIKLKEISGYSELMNFFPGSEDMIKKAAVLLVIVCNFKRITQKYSNRGYMYGLLEAGHVAQNIYLYCTEQNLAVVEIGGFNDIELSKFLQLKYPEIVPLVCFLIGPTC